MRLRAQSCVIAAAGVVTALCIPVSIAAGADSTEINVLVIQSSEPTIGSELTISMDAPETLSSAQSGVNQLVGSTSVSSETVSGDTLVVVVDADGDATAVDRSSHSQSSAVASLVSDPDINPDPPPVGGNGYQDLHCNHHRSFSDGNGTFSIIKDCGEKNAPWGYHFSAGLLAICVGPVSEIGLRWWINGTEKPRQAAHPIEGCGYSYHGTLHPAAHDYMWYFDRFDFAVEVDGGEGEADLEIGGGIHFLATA
jgi:hypothetical protein